MGFRERFLCLTDVSNDAIALTKSRKYLTDILLNVCRTFVICFLYVPPIWCTKNRLKSVKNVRIANPCTPVRFRYSPPTYLSR
jgi:hypothetical protein